jgi:hypothetical protein
MAYTKALLKAFDRLTMKLSSSNQMDRIEARLYLAEFEKVHGNAICKEMYEVLKRRDAANERQEKP